MTCTTTDPLVATLFAIECRNKGLAVVQLAPMAPVQDLIGPGNYFADLECAVNIRLEPAEFARYVLTEIDVDTAIAHLSDMGITDLPERIKDNFALQCELEYTRMKSQRLSDEQIAVFNGRILGEIR